MQRLAHLFILLHCLQQLSCDATKPEISPFYACDCEKILRKFVSQTTHALRQLRDEKEDLIDLKHIFLAKPDDVSCDGGISVCEFVRQTTATLGELRAEKEDLGRLKSNLSALRGEMELFINRAKEEEDNRKNRFKELENLSEEVSALRAENAVLRTQLQNRVETLDSRQRRGEINLNSTIKKAAENVEGEFAKLRKESLILKEEMINMRTELLNFRNVTSILIQQLAEGKTSLQSQVDSIGMQLNQTIVQISLINSTVLKNTESTSVLNTLNVKISKCKNDTIVLKQVLEQEQETSVRFQDHLNVIEGRLNESQAGLEHMNNTLQKHLETGNEQMQPGVLDNRHIKYEEAFSTVATITTTCSCKYISRETILKGHDGKKMLEFGDEIPSGSSVSFYCSDVGMYSLTDPKTVTCPRDCNWSSTLFPSCVVANRPPGCASLMKKNGSELLIHPEKEYYSIGDSIIFTCPPGKELTKAVERTLCSSSGWIPAFVPDCQ